MREIDDNESSIRSRSSVVSEVLAGFVGPLVLLLNAVGVEWRTALAAGLGIVVLMIAGASLLLLLGLERVASSSAGFFVIGGAVSWGLIAALSQLFGVVVSRNHAWIPGLLVCCIGLVSSRHRVSFVSALRRSPDSLDREIVPLWVAILAILGVSDWSFAALAIAIAGVHWVLSLTGLVGWYKRTSFVVIWVFLILFRISTQLLGWRVLPWAFTAIAMRSCGVTHFLLEVGSSRSSSSIRFDQSFVREYAFDEYLLLELLVEPDPSSLPKVSWKQ